MNQRKKRAVSTAICGMLCLSLSATAFAADEAGVAETGKTGVLDVWSNPGSDDSVNAKPMLRFWFPDAGAGLTQEQIKKLNDEGLTEWNEEYLYEVSDMINELYAAGFGGVEMTMLADSANYGTELVSEIGWGSEAWTRILCQALETANSVGDGDGNDFKVDITMTAHWPLIIDTIDPNDDAQQQQLSYTIQAIDAENISETVTLDLPVQAVQDGKNGVFLFKDTLVGVTLGKMREEEVEVTKTSPTPQDPVEETTTEIQQTLDMKSLTSLQSSGTDTYSAGVPKGNVVYQYTDGRYYDLSLAGTGDELGDPLQEGEAVALYPSEDYYTFADEENGGYIYVVDTETGEGLSPEGLSYERTDNAQQTGPIINYSSVFTVTKDGEDITDSVTVYYDSGVATNMGGMIISADGSKNPCSVLANSSKATFGIVAEEEATEEKVATERQYMDDIQQVYTVSGADVQAAIEAVGALEEGETYVLVPVYRRGTGQVSSGGSTITMDNRTYCVSYYSSDGAQAVIDYWENNMLDIPVEVCDAEGNAKTVTLREEMAGNSAGSIFEDSLEMNTSGSVWSAQMLDDFQTYMGYDVSEYLPVVAGIGVYNDETQTAEKVQEDYENVKEKIFNDEHVKVISDWANEVGGGYRFQSGSDDAQRSTYVDIIEADNGSLSSVLKANGTVNAKGDKENPYLSMEAITSTSIDMDYYQTMMELNMNFVRGINRIVIHGIPFTKALNGHCNEWPGWVFGEPALGKGYGVWDSREPFYNEESDIKTFTDYVTRIQALLQETEENVPIMVVGDAKDTEFEVLRDNGYHYNVTSEYGVMFDNMSPENITDGVLNPDTMGVQMLVLDNLGNTVDQYQFLERLLAYANAGMKIVIYGDTQITSLAGADYGDYDTMTDEKQTDAYAQELYEQLLENENVISGITTQEELLQIMGENVKYSCSFQEDGLEAVHLTDEKNEYYFFYNSALEEGYEVVQYGGVGEGLNLTNVKGKDVTTDVTLKTDGAAVYQMNPYNGEIRAITDAADNGDGTVTIHLDVAAWDTAVLAVSSEDISTAEEEEEAEEAAEKASLDLTEASWNLKIDSYGPKTDVDETAQFTETEITSLTIEDTKLGLWKDLKDTVTRENLLSLGITDEKLEAASSRITGQGEKLLNGEGIVVDENAIQYVSGIGWYTSTFSWDGTGAGAVIEYSHEDSSVESDAGVNGDMVTKITITNENGTFEFTGLNQLSDKVDIGDVLVNGENTIEVKLVTTLRNREWIEGGATGPMFNSMQNYGLTGLRISEY